MKHIYARTRTNSRGKTDRVTNMKYTDHQVSSSPPRKNKTLPSITGTGMEHVGRKRNPHQGRDYPISDRTNATLHAGAIRWLAFVSGLRELWCHLWCLTHVTGWSAASAGRQAAPRKRSKQSRAMVKISSKWCCSIVAASTEPLE